jgi:predicted transposase/invertase (TIGR01784 family)
MSYLRSTISQHEKLPEEELKELMAMDPNIEKAEEKLELLSSDEFMRELAEARARAQSDWVSSMEGSKADGIAIGEAKGKAEGITEGKAEVALMLLKKGMDSTFISEVTGLSVQEIKRLTRD